MESTDVSHLDLERSVGASTNITQANDISPPCPCHTLEHSTSHSTATVEDGCCQSEALHSIMGVMRIRRGDTL